MRRRGAIWVHPLPASHFRCRFVLRENVFVKLFDLVVYLCACACLSVERSDTDLYQDKHTSQCQIKNLKNLIFLIQNAGIYVII